MESIEGNISFNKEGYARNKSVRKMVKHRKRKGKTKHKMRSNKINYFGRKRSEK